MSRIYLITLAFIVLYPTITFSAEIVNPQQVYTYEEMTRDLSLLKEKYPEELEVISIGSTTFGRDIPTVKLGKGSKNVLFIGSHHGREWLTTNLLMEMIEVYSEAYHTKENLFGFDTSILDNVSIWFVPMLNPDGVTIQQQGADGFPLSYKEILLEMNENDLDFKKWKANGVGIDLNRQYPAGWDEITGDSPHVSYHYYKGSRPLEAEEVRALVRFTYEIDPLIAVAYHSSGRVLYWYYNNRPHLVERDKRIAEKFSKMTGYELEDPPENAVGGGYTDWFISEFKRPAFTAEISFNVTETNPPLYVFSEEWRRNKAIGLMIASEATKIN
ncbi:carboxypeptidase [Bacillus luteolus]|uniref:Carboxypeptidase n=1 Tax=Litchfieldia luteola TaxID=682179 RepID=A0ABR9QEB6_9BACI|nr:M14 family zinc carboxypeptidase [Cytobacillus luteolus]MBE4906830.1 carboxypeptidase [Cytobacillus luteolus]MBP1940516.1 g-D-glutamyl-meso-diaminopimelate peptidase [Cytobacillus luteolus]